MTLKSSDRVTNSEECNLSERVGVLRSLKKCGVTFFPLVLMIGCCLQGFAQESRVISVERTFTTTLSYQCIVTIPKEYKSDPEKKWPMILFLHGGGSPSLEKLKQSTKWLTKLPAIVVTPICPPDLKDWRYQTWNPTLLSELVSEVEEQYRVDPKLKSVIGFSMGGSGAWELPFHERKHFSKVIVIAGVCHPWSLRHYPKLPIWVFVGKKDRMRKEQEETVTSAKRFGVDVVQTSWQDADHSGILQKAQRYQPLLDWLTTTEDLRQKREVE